MSSTFFASVTAAISAGALARSTARTARARALGLLALGAGTTLLGWLFLALSVNAPVPDAWGFRGFPGIFAVVFGWIGYLVATRQPRDPIGWCFLVASALSGLQVLGAQYAALRRRLPNLNVMGGCCGTDHRHVEAMATACAPLFR